jgi:hypothetical protein
MAVLVRRPEESMLRMTALLATGNQAKFHPIVTSDAFSADAFSLLPNSNTRHVSY